jgi:hypothetical protein
MQHRKKRPCRFCCVQFAVYSLLFAVCCVLRTAVAVAAISAIADILKRGKGSGLQSESISRQLLFRPAKPYGSA